MDSKSIVRKDVRVRVPPEALSSVRFVGDHPFVRRPRTPTALLEGNNAQIFRCSRGGGSSRPSDARYVGIADEVAEAIAAVMPHLSVGHQLRHEGGTYRATYAYSR